MTIFELAELINTQVGLFLTFFMSFLSLTSAFLVAAYFGSEKLRGSIAVLVTGLYSMGSFFLITLSERMAATMIAIRDQMGVSMAWHPAYSEPEFLMPFILRFAIFLMICAYLGSIWYFLKYTVQTASTDD